MKTPADFPTHPMTQEERRHRSDVARSEFAAKVWRTQAEEIAAGQKAGRQFLVCAVLASLMTFLGFCMWSVAQNPQGDPYPAATNEPVQEQP